MEYKVTDSIVNFILPYASVLRDYMKSKQPALVTIVQQNVQRFLRRENANKSVPSISVEHQLILVYFLIKEQTQQIKHNILMVHDNQVVINRFIAEQCDELT